MTRFFGEQLLCPLTLIPSFLIDCKILSHLILMNFIMKYLILMNDLLQMNLQNFFFRKCTNSFKIFIRNCFIKSQYKVLRFANRFTRIYMYSFKILESCFLSFPLKFLGCAPFFSALPGAFFFCGEGGLHLLFFKRV